jgi:hypothetical protein
VTEEHAAKPSSADRRRDPAPTVDSSEPRPPTLPSPTYWPATLALSACFALWGVLTSIWMVGVGVAGAGLAIAGWIRELGHDPVE